MHLAIVMAPLLRLAPALLLALPDPAMAEERFERSLEVAPGGRLIVQLERGSIQLDSHPSPGTLRVEARGFGATNVDFSLERRGGDVVLRSINAEWLRWLTLQPRVVVRAWVPRSLAVALETRDGGVVARGIAGRLSARTAGSPIRIEEIAGPVELDSSGGRIEARDLSGSLHARSGGGQLLHLRGGGGEIRLRAE
jgi:hypothetical protein